MDDTGHLRIVKAKYNFRGKNNDELCFKKGDFVVITQPADSDWWEGTLNGVTGWFPTSYVQETRFDQLPDEVKQNLFPNRVPGKSPSHTGGFPRSYHSEVLASVIEAETAFVAELESSWNTLIHPISSANILSKEEFALVSSNYEEVLALHRQFLATLKECGKQALNVRRVGRVFLEHVPAFRVVYEKYASNHPRAVRILHAQHQRGSSLPSQTHDLGRFIAEHSSKTNKASSTNGAANPADVQMLLPLTTALALPLCRLEKVPLLLRELERHLDEGHFDRGDTQRALAVFKQLIADCQELRMLRELELDLANASVAALPSALAMSSNEPSKLIQGVVFLSPVKLATGTDVVDRLFVLYPSRLVILSAEPDLTKLAFEADFPLTHLYVDRNLPSPDAAIRFLHSFSLYFRPAVPLASPEEATPTSPSAPSGDCFVVVCASASLSSRWIDLLSSVCKSKNEFNSNNNGGANSPRQNHRNIVPSSNSDEIVKNSNRRSTSSSVIASHGFPPQSLSDHSIHERRRSNNLHHGQRAHPPAVLSILAPLSCVVGNLPLTATTFHSGMQSSSMLAALAPASPHPARKSNVLSAVASSVPAVSTPLARKRFGLNTGLTGGLTAVGGDSNMLNAEDQQLMSVVDSFVSVPQTVPIGAALPQQQQQQQMSPGSVHREMEMTTFQMTQRRTHLNGSGPSGGSLTIEPVVSGLTTLSTSSLPVPQRPTTVASRFSAATRNDLLIAEEEKLLLEDIKPLNGGQQNGMSSGGGGLQERTLVDAVYSLWDYVAELRGEVANLRQLQIK